MKNPRDCESEERRKYESERFVSREDGVRRCSEIEKKRFFFHRRERDRKNQHVTYGQLYIT